jgi:hypothetical protein
LAPPLSNRISQAERRLSSLTPASDINAYGSSSLDCAGGTRSMSATPFQGRIQSVAARSALPNRKPISQTEPPPLSSLEPRAELARQNLTPQYRSGRQTLLNVPEGHTESII